MNDQFQREEAIFDAALLLAPAERDVFIDKSCDDDLQLLERIRALLKSHAHTNGILEQPALDQQPGATMRDSPMPFEKPGDKIGRYKLLQQIGEGGCGVVYMAEQEGPVRRRVALKIIKLGMDTDRKGTRLNPSHGYNSDAA